MATAGPLHYTHQGTLPHSSAKGAQETRALHVSPRRSPLLHYLGIVFRPSAVVSLGYRTLGNQNQKPPSPSKGKLFPLRNVSCHLSIFCVQQLTKPGRIYPDWRVPPCAVLDTARGCDPGRFWVKKDLSDSVHRHALQFSGAERLLGGKGESVLMLQIIRPCHRWVLLAKRVRAVSKGEAKRTNCSQPVMKSNFSSKENPLWPCQ